MKAYRLAQRRRFAQGSDHYSRLLRVESLEERNLLALSYADINPDVSDLSDADGTSGGRVNGITVAAGTNNQTMYAASEFGGIFKSTDGASTWMRLDRHLPTRGRDVKVDPSNINKVYATSLYDGRVNSVSGIEVSTDGGDTWVHPATSTAPAAFNCANPANQPSANGIAIDPVTPSNVWIGTNCGLARSTNSGITWTFIDPTRPTGVPTAGSPASDVWDVVVHDGGIIDVLTDEGHFRSTTNGASWTGGTGGLNTPGQPSSPAALVVSPDEPYVLFVANTNDQNLWESNDAGATWTNLGTPDGRRQARGTMVAVNQRDNADVTGDGNADNIFDVWFGDVGMYRATCVSQNAIGGANRCPAAVTGPAASPPPTGWNGSFTRPNGGHDDMGDLVFDTNVTSEALPVLFSSDGGVHQRTGGNVNAPMWTRANVGLHATWIFSMDLADRMGPVQEDLYVGLQDDGSWGTRKAGQSPKPDDWHNENCCDIFDMVADANRVVFDTCCGMDAMGNFTATLQIGSRDRLTGSSPIATNPPGNVPIDEGAEEELGGEEEDCEELPTEEEREECEAEQEQEDGVSFSFPDVIDTFGDRQYAIANGNGVFFTNDITASPVVWTQLDATNDPAAGGTGGFVRAALSGGTPTFYVLAGTQLWRFQGTNSATADWTRIDNNPGGGAIAFFNVDESNPNRLYAIRSGGAAPNRIIFSTDGGANWSPDTELDNLMTLGGYFRNFAATFISFDPFNSSYIVAGGLDSGVFMSTDSGNSWRLITDPIDSGYSGVPHLPEPRFAYFDHEPAASDVNVYVGTRGRGVWRINATSFDLDPDRFEPNNTIASATVLGSLAKIIERDLTIHNSTDVDFFQYTAQDTGKLAVNVWDDFNGIIDVRVKDAAGNIIANGVQADFAGINRQTLMIPVVGQEQYFIEVYSSAGHTNDYDLEIENFPAPVPIVVDLAAADDSGRSDSDNVTNVALGHITVLADLSEFGDFDEDGAFDAGIDMDILTPAEVAANEPGAAVEVFVRGVSQGFATPVAGSNNTQFDFQFQPGDLLQGLNFVTAAVRIFDGKTPQADARSQLSEPLLITLDTVAPNKPAVANLLDASDSGTSNTDNVTNVQQPAFDGTLINERNAIVRVRAGGVVVGQGLSSGAINATWEITVEPLRDQRHLMTVTAEDLAGNVSTPSDPLEIEIDTLAPNTPLLDLIESSDTGRHNDDNITKDNTPSLSATTTDPTATAPAPYNHLLGPNLIYRIFDRLENSAEILRFTSALTASTQESTTLGPLLDGVHDLKLEVEDRAGNISHDYLLPVLIDTVAPTGTANLFNDSDTGIWGFPATMHDGVTGDMTPLLWGKTEADALVRAALDRDPLIPGDLGDADGTAVAIPLDGDDAFPPPPGFDGNYFLQTVLPLMDGEHTLEVFFQDVAGNESPADDDATLKIFIDTAGPKIENVTRGEVSTDNHFSFDGVTSVFEPKPSDNGPDPLVHSIVIHFSDLPDRTAAFDDVTALFEAAASEEGNYSLKGDHNGFIAIVAVNVTFTTIAGDGLPETAEVELVFDQPLPDDRYTLFVSDSITDPAGNPLDGESGALGPFEGNDVPEPTPPIFPTGDGAHGGDFWGRFTIDSRPEIGTFALGTTFLDINGNFVVDSEGKDRDYTNRDIAFLFGFRDDKIFAGNFNVPGAGAASGYDKLGAFGNAGAGAAWHWRLDFNHDGVVDYDVLSGVQNSADPVAGNFSLAHDGDEVGLFNSGKWYLDSGGDNNVGGPGDTQLNGNMKGQPIVGDFDGDGLDDLGAWDAGNAGTQFDGTFQFDLASNGLTGVADKTIQFDIAGTFQKAVAADMNGDGIDDIGLFVSRREAIVPAEAAEWYFLISDRAAPGAAIGNVKTLDHLFRPEPFGKDLFAQFGDEAALPVVGNFDPPTTDPLSLPDPDPVSPLDVNGDGEISPLDALLIFNELNKMGSHPMSAPMTGPDGQIWMLDTSGDGYLSALDALLVFNQLNSDPDPQPEGESAAVPASPSDEFDLIALLADDQATANQRRRR